MRNDTALGCYLLPSTPAPIPTQEEEAVDFCDEESPGERAASQGYRHSPPIRLFEVYSSTVEFITPIVASVSRGRRQMGGRNDCGREGECINKGPRGRRRRRSLFALLVVDYREPRSKLVKAGAGMTETVSLYI